MLEKKMVISYTTFSVNFNHLLRYWVLHDYSNRSQHHQIFDNNSKTGVLPPSKNTFKIHFLKITSAELNS